MTAGSPALSRRAFLQGAAAALAAASIPIQLAGATEAAAAVPPPLPAAPIGNVSWGWSLDGSTWTTGSRSAQEAIWDAMSDMPDEGHVSIARCVLNPLEYRGDRMAAELEEWMASPTYRPAHAVTAAFSAANADCDWEGELSDAIHGADCAPLDAPVLAALSAALLRATDVGASLRVATMDPRVCGPSTRAPIADADVRQAVRRDTVLADDLSEAVRRWVGSTKIPRAPRTLSTYDERTVEIAYDEELGDFVEVTHEASAPAMA